MIVEFLVNTVYTMFQLLFSIIPDLPPMPAEIVTASQWIIDQVIVVTSVLNMVLSTPLLIAIIVVHGGMMAFETVYHFILWILRKIPVLGIS